MTRGRIDRKLIIEKALSLFTKQGYQNTTMGDVAKACYIQKASLYHHIPSRHALMIMAVEYVINEFNQQILPILNLKNVPVSEQLNEIAKQMEEFLVNNQHSNFIFNLAFDGLEKIPEIKQLISNYFGTWVSSIYHLLLTRFVPPQAKLLAEEHVAKLQGAFLMKKTLNNNEIIKRARMKLSSLLD